MDLQVAFQQSKIVGISFMGVNAGSKSGGDFQITADRESKVDIKFDLDENEREAKFAMTSKIPNLEKVEIALNWPDQLRQGEVIYLCYDSRFERFFHID